LRLETPTDHFAFIEGRGVSFAEHFRHFVVDYGYLAVFLGIFLEDFGLPTPGETMLIAGAILASHGSLNIVWLLPIAWAGAVCGDSVGFVIGATGGNKLLTRHGGKVGITEERLQRVETFFARYGDIVVVFARFFVILRQLNGIVAGTLEMPWPRFFLYNAIGAALWVGVWGGATYWLGRRFFDYLRSFGWSGRLVIALGALAVVAILARLWWHWRERHGATPTIAKRDKTVGEKS
jgi:membrane protein DedA with SNARE-associated domain